MRRIMMKRCNMMSMKMKTTGSLWIFIPLPGVEQCHRS
ncbi:hypothetical protein A2U01_0081816, partial [Trifolium medium]|nr:hypothetical protein [Trifolium medium]